MKSEKCSNCSANLSLDDNLKTLTCPYCGSVKYLEEADKIQATPVVKEIEYAVEKSQSTNEHIPARPTINGWLCFFLLLCYFWPCIIYLAIIESKQKKWDAKYKKDKNQ